MLKEAGENYAEFCELVDHPCGSDGGEFPQYETFVVDSYGAVCYDTSYPESRLGVFGDWDWDVPADYVNCRTKESATTRLKTELENAEKAVAAIKKLLGLLEDPSTAFEVTFNQKPFDESKSKDYYFEEDEDE